MKNIFIVLILFISLHAFAQNEASFWYFGQNAGVRFDAEAGTVSAVTNGQINTTEGCTSISDTDGNLLFYTDGQTVWNRNHQIMSNGNYFGGTGLLGDPSSTSSGLIVPKPEDPSKYYIFTVDEPHHLNASVYPNQYLGQYSGNPNDTVPVSDDGFNNGFNYSLVDMNLNGGLGDIDPVEKNIPLVTYNPSLPLHQEYKCSEKITAVRAEDCSSFWVITHFVDSFYAFKVEATGVSTTPVISTVGPIVPVQGYRRNALGYLKASPDGSKLVVAHFGEGQVTGGNAGGGVYLFDFDNNTGTVSNSLELYSPQNDNSPYGVEFSAENRKVYASIGLGPSGNGASQILQWDLESSDISASGIIIHTSNSLSAGALQLGIDKRIYRAQVEFSDFLNTGRYLGVINDPEANGLDANYDEFGVLLDVNGGSQNLSRIGLPPFIQSLFNTQIDIIRDGNSTTELKLCTGDSYTLAADDLPGADYVWTRDGVPLTETGFQLFVDTPGFYEVFIEPNNGECPIEGSAVVGIFDIPVANPIADINACDDDNDAQLSFNFADQTSEILGSQDTNTFTVTYFENQTDANNNENPITLPFVNSNTTQNIVARIEHVENSNCYDTEAFTITVFDTPTVTSLPEQAVFCDEEGATMDGIITLDLSQYSDNILGTQNASETAITYYPTLADAENKTNILPINYTNTTSPFNYEVFVRIENTTETTCFSIDNFNVTINPAPVANNTTILQCDEDGTADGLTNFNINQVLEDITNNAPNRSVKYYLSQADAQNDIGDIDGNNYENTSNPQTIYTRVINTESQCVNFSTVILEVSTTASNDTALIVCDIDGTEDGFFDFNLADAQEDITNGLPNGLDIDYYETYENALIENNPLGTSFTNTQPYNQTIYARVENSNACYGISEVALTVLRLPNVETEAETFYCLNSFPDTVTLTGGIIDDIPNNYFYNWSTGETTSEIEIDAPGTYTVTVTNTNFCSKERTITVLSSNIATITNIEIIDVTDDNSVTVLVTGEGDYEFALEDSNGPYQDSNVFENVPPGIYTVYVRDKNNCGIAEESISVIGFPKFFTPNNDSFNDFWQVSGISEQFQSDTRIRIFDRYGKLLKELDPLNVGWDGTFNGKPMPSSDYWFSVELEDGRTFTSHFALKR